MRPSSAAAVCIVTVAVLCAGAHARLAHWTPESQGWQRVAPAAGDAVASLTVGLCLDAAGVADFVSRVSDPTNAMYGQYLSLEQLADKFGPSPSAVSAVVSWFRSVGATSVEVSASRDALWVQIPVSRLAAVTRCTFHKFVHPTSSRVLLRTADSVAWAWPKDVAAAVEIVTGVTDFLDTPLERRAVRALRDAAAGTAVSDVSGFPSDPRAPEVTRMLGSEDVMIVEFKPYCQDGTVASGGKCASGSSPSKATLDVTPRAPRAFSMSWDLSDLSLTGDTYMTPPLRIPAFSRVNVTVTVEFADGSSSPAGWYPTDWSPSPWVNPRVIHEQYGVPVGTRGTHPNNSQAVASFEGQYINPTDLDDFFNAVGLPVDQPTVKGYDNTSIPAAGGEASLDIQYIMGVGAGVPSTFWSVNGPGPAVGDSAYILTWAYLVGNDTSPPLVTSISYGDTEMGYFNKFGDFSYIIRMNTELSKMAARGLTVLAGSGDAGATNVGEAGNDISPTDPDCSVCRPFFPSNSPYVTSVSATFLTTNALPMCDNTLSDTTLPVVCSQVGEQAVSVTGGIRWTTGGGFSNFTKQQSWQADAVNAYLSAMSHELPPSSFYNRSGRAYPDVGTIGHNLFLRWGGRSISVDGTSASGPVMAGIVSLLNDALLHAKRPVVGLMNPALYQAAASVPSTFQDVVVGFNGDGDIQGRGSKFPTFCDNGFACAPGWDPVTGLGSPYFPALKDYFLSL